MSAPECWHLYFWEKEILVRLNSISEYQGTSLAICEDVLFSLLEICHDESMDILNNKKKKILPIEISREESFELISA